VAGELLFDKKAVISILERSQKKHSALAEFSEDWSDEVATAEVVVSASTHLLARGRGDLALEVRWQREHESSIDLFRSDPSIVPQRRK
jgi:hypothetical protein